MSCAIDVLPLYLGEQRLDLPADTKLLAIGVTAPFTDAITLYFLRPGMPPYYSSRRVLVGVDGIMWHQYRADQLEHIGSVQVGAAMWHAFEIKG